MKHIKTFENIQENPQIGDYVSCEDLDVDLFEYVHNFLSNNIGKIVKISDPNNLNLK